MPKNNKGLAPLFIVFIVALLGIGFYSFIQKQKQSNVLAGLIRLAEKYKSEKPTDLGGEQVFLDAFGNWKTYKMEGFLVDLPQGDPSKFEFRTHSGQETSDIFDKGEVTRRIIMNAYSTSIYADKYKAYYNEDLVVNYDDSKYNLWNIGNLLFGGSVTVYKITGSSGVISAKSYTDQINKGKKDCYQLLIEPLSRAEASNGAKVFRYQQSGWCDEGFNIAPGYFVEGKDYLLEFSGGQDLLPDVLMERIVASTKFSD